MESFIAGNLSPSCQHFVIRKCNIEILSNLGEMRTIRQVRIELFFASFIVLFQELALIRWLPGQVRVLAYFPNLILLSAFLGLGVGCLRAGKSSLLWLWPASLGIVVLSAIAGSHIAFR